MRGCEQKITLIPVPLYVSVSLFHILLSTLSFSLSHTHTVFFLVGVHVKPSDVIQELEALGPAFQSASNFHGNSRGVVMGDFNAGCR